ncbi:MAG: isoprenyl transferase [Alloprevotella sp.]|nr:isoprenyl transferase [Alloprevotella sp.]
MNSEKYNIPTHVAIIMDGNGRWAKQRGLDRSLGHQKGVETVRKITTEATQMGIRYLTLYTFSTENWTRPHAEVAALMGLILESMEEEIFVKNQVRLRIIGDITRLPQEVQKAILTLQQHTAQFSRMTCVLALNYSARWELTQATKRLIQKKQEGLIDAQSLTPEDISHELSTSFMPDPDLLIRTGGEQRLSNFLLWQSAYTEFYFTDKYWPDFSTDDFREAIVAFQHRQRRFGQTGEQVDQSTE